MWCYEAIRGASKSSLHLFWRWFCHPRISMQWFLTPRIGKSRRNRCVLLREFWNWVSDDGKGESQRIKKTSSVCLVDFGSRKWSQWPFCQMELPQIRGRSAREFGWIYAKWGKTFWQRNHRFRSGKRIKNSHRNVPIIYDLCKNDISVTKHA